ncbi:hypothetical protein MKX08_000365 [Trichoderma sp. CBMAI-0020]|nr:hypothetical protein MKX08_000365 [Trichoderma sp. CBMAI-0020]
MKKYTGMKLQLPLLTSADAAASESTNKESQSDSTSFRVRGVPTDWSREQLQSFLKSQENGLDVSIKSLAAEAGEQYQSATITFPELPSRLQKYPHWDIVVPETFNAMDAGEQCLSIDKDFYGLTTLFDPTPRDHKIDVIALSGLGSHAFGSFRQRKGSHMWLRDSLPYDLTSENTNKPMARIMIYGYESGVVNSSNMQNLEDLATTLHNSLLAIATGSKLKPIIFLGHSLGGLIIKQLLISLSRSEFLQDKELLRAVYGVIFFGTPHNGEQDKSEVFCFYETLKSPTAVQNESGRWEITGPAAILVTKSSATNCRPWENGPEHICAIAGTHSEIVKFGRYDTEYKNVRERMRSLSRRALTVGDDRQHKRAEFLIPYPPNEDFIERPELQNEMRRQFGLGEYQGPSQPRRRVSLCSLGGNGKTQIAIAFAYWLREVNPDVSIFWVHASNAHRFRESYANIAKTCNVPGTNDPGANVLLLVKEWLEAQHQSRWLLIIDNADDSELFFSERNTETKSDSEYHKLVHYLPDCPQGCMLLSTTRNMNAAVDLCRGGDPIEVPCMTSNEAYQLLRAVLPAEISTADASALSSRLDHLPLALAQAASFIKKRRITIRNYVDRLDEGDSEFVGLLNEPFQTEGRDSRAPHAVTATWIISFEQIERIDKTASDILSFFGVVHFQAIPKILIEHYYRELYPNENENSTSSALLEALDLLRSFSFISEGTGQDVNMHRLVQLVIQKWLIAKKQMAEYARHAMMVISKLFPTKLFPTKLFPTEDFGALLRYLPHASSVLGKAASDLNNDDFTPSARSTERSRNFKQTSISVTTYGTRRLAPLYSREYISPWDQDRSEEAEDLISYAFERRKLVLGEFHVDTLESMRALSKVFRHQNRIGEAKKLEVRTLEFRNIVFGDQHPSTLMSLHDRANMYCSEGKFKIAKNLVERVLKKQQGILRAHHPQIISTMVLLARIRKQMGKTDQAIGLMESCLSATEAELGQDHTTTVDISSTLEQWRKEADTSAPNSQRPTSSRSSLQDRQRRRWRARHRNIGRETARKRERKRELAWKGNTRYM